MDRTRNSAGSITHSAELVVEFQGHCEKVTADMTDLGKNPFILGFLWLQHHNPEIDWSKGTVKMTRCPQHCHMLQDKSAFIQEVEEEEYNNQYYTHETIRALEAQQESQKPKEKTCQDADRTPGRNSRNLEFAWTWDLASAYVLCPCCSSGPRGRKRSGRSVGARG